MAFLTLNLVLALIWMFLTGAFSAGGFIFGLVVGYLVLFLAQPFMGSRTYVLATVGSVKLLAVFLYELVVANLLLAKEILRPKPNLKPAVVSLQVPELTPGQSVLLGHMISLTPGTLTVDNEHETRTLYIHTIFGQDPERTLDGARSFARLIVGATGAETGRKAAPEVTP
jgi:multicomponent Na+:H+ antiporter subunit E